MYNTQAGILMYATEQSDGQPTAQDILKVTQNMELGEFIGYAYYNNYSFTHNLNPGMLKMQLKALQVELLKSDKKSREEEYSNKAALRKLKSNTLYIPDYTLKEVDFYGRMVDRDEKGIQKLFSKYKHPYKVVSAEALDKMLSNSDKPIYVFNYCKSFNSVYMSITEAQTGKIIYINNDSFERNAQLEASDLKDIYKLIN